jgi:hypothetical protein
MTSCITLFRVCRDKTHLSKPEALRARGPAACCRRPHIRERRGARRVRRIESPTSSPGATATRCQTAPGICRNNDVLGRIGNGVFRAGVHVERSDVGDTPMQGQPRTKLSSSCHAPKHAALEAGRALLRARMVLLESWTSAGRSDVRGARDKGNFTAADDVIIRTTPRPERESRRRRKKRRFRLAGGRGQGNRFSRSQLHDSKKKWHRAATRCHYSRSSPEGRSMRVALTRPVLLFRLSWVGFFSLW